MYVEFFCIHVVIKMSCRNQQFYKKNQLARMLVDK